MVALAADAPRNFETSFTESYGSQELNAVPIDAGQSKDVKLKVRPPNTIGAGRYPVAMRATAEDATAKTDVALEITGQPQLDITGRDGSLSAGAERGRGDHDPGRDHQFRHRAGGPDRARRHGADRLEDHLRAEADRPHRARARTVRCRR